mmetsp:Transcript_10369/g.15165  ORF Transcript_10369/g.15165 Transcript_10369/m.15165 type:complete len:109 (+) Transcript_10369:786-1112(+)
MLANEEDSLVISCAWELNLDKLIEVIWDYLNLIRIYTKKRGEAPDLVEPSIVRNGSTVETMCNSIHADFKKNFKFAYVWGLSAKHCPQRVGLSHMLADQDVLEIRAGN